MGIYLQGWVLQVAVVSVTAAALLIFMGLAVVNLVRRNMAGFAALLAVAVKFTQILRCRLHSGCTEKATGQQTAEISEFHIAP
ncbi:hypothetical protein ACWAU3_17800 [Shewanella sp. JL219SE-S6]